MVINCDRCGAHLEGGDGMSLDITLITQTKNPGGSGIWIREDGRMKEITREEWDVRFPDREPVTVFVEATYAAWRGNITGNLHLMADEAGLNEVMWDAPFGLKARDALVPLTAGLNDLLARPKHFKQFDSPNKWGVYSNLVEFVQEYLEACQRFPDAIIEINK
jgi:hypothetical protein